MIGSPTIGDYLVEQKYVPVVVVPLIGYGFGEEDQKWWEDKTIPETRVNVFAKVYYYTTLNGQVSWDPIEFKFAVLSEKEWDIMLQSNMGMSFSYHSAGSPFSVNDMKHIINLVDSSIFEGYTYLGGVKDWVGERDNVEPYLLSLTEDYERFLAKTLSMFNQNV